MAPQKKEHYSAEYRQASSLLFLNRVRESIRGLRASDKAIALLLFIIFFLSIVRGMYALERVFQVESPLFGGTLVEGIVGSPRFVNPVLSLTDADRDLTALMYAGLMGYDSQGMLVPALAKSYTISENGKVYTFVLRENAQFSDGTPVRATDVVFTIEKVLDPNLKSPEFQDWKGIVAKTLDERTVEITLPQAFDPFIEEATLGILPEHLWKDVTSLDFPFVTRILQPVGAGPFVFKTLKQDSEGKITSYELRANEKFVLGRPYLDRIRFKFYTDQIKLQDALIAGDVDSAYGVIGENVLTTSYTRIFGVFFNEDVEPLFKDTSVREALSLAINRQAIVDNVLGGYGTASFGPVPSGLLSSDYKETAIRSGFGEAEKVLNAGGWEYVASTTLWTKTENNELKTLSVTIKTVQAPELKAVAGQIKGDWETLGVPTTILLYTPLDLTEDVIRPRDFGALLFGQVARSGSDLYAFWHGGEGTHPGLNIAGYQSKEADTLLALSRNTVPGKGEEKQQLQKINDEIAKDFPAAFTHTPDFVYNIPNSVQGIVLTDIASPSDRFKTVTGWYRYTEFVWPFFINQ